MPKPLIIDNGLCVGFAARMARDMEVAYFSVWNNAFPRSREVAVGTGMKNIERVDDPITYFLDGKASHIIVPDLYLNGYENLAKHVEGFPLWGSGEGNRLELDRWFLKEWLEAHGCSVNESVEIEGIDALREYLDAHEDTHVKVSTFRGDWETNRAIYRHSWFPSLVERLGAIADRIRFIVEEDIPDAKEIGIDSFFQGGTLVEPFFYGPEIKDAGYAGQLKTLADLSKEELKIVHAISEYTEETQYANFFSNEMRELKDGRVYMTDATCRVPSPPGGVMMTAMRNFTKFVLETAEDGYPTPDYGDAQWLCEIVLKSDHLEEHWLEVDIPPSMKERVALHNYCEVDGKTWVIPHDSGYVEFSSACGWGTSLDEAAEMALETANSLTAFHLYFDDDVLRKAEKQFEKL